MIDALPFEITAQIFELCVLDNPSPLKHPAQQLRLAAVCVSWRDICFALGQLWARLNVYKCPKFLEGGTDDDEAELCQMAIAWLSRAGSHPIKLGIHAEERSTTLSYALLPIFSGQISQLDIPLQRLSSVLRGGALPQLKSLCLRCPPSIRLDQDDKGHYILAPKLQRLQLLGYFDTDIYIAFPWSQITDLLIDGPPYSWVHSNFRLLDLEQLETFSIVCEYDYRSPRSIKTLPKLQKFRATLARDADILEYLSLPALRSLEIIGLAGASELPTNIVELGRRSQWSLRHLRLANIQCSRIAYLLDSEVMEFIEELEISVTWRDPTFFDALLSRLRAGALLNLHSLSIKACPITHSMHITELVEVVRLRSEKFGLQAFALELVKRHDWELWKNEVMLEFRELVGRVPSVRVHVHGVAV
ncbi:hypothetical protein MIND_00989800 [Mycena indigotica]|uniref:F-box domain-containing protein n=1 Tax=Mycena indigotica TaxID=2126181 RepID=A0A8H6S8Z4_9AGAR|nr:uncharacterized protein MIND_00989800 [Mycena indigotica]KAF7294533.1 hypothetical protein MIND_00989800 [Mycena indigotica]